MTKEVCTSVSGLIEKLQNSGKKYDIDKIRNAGEYAEALHEGQFRVSGDPYISHPVAVADIAAGLGLDTNSICAKLLFYYLKICLVRTVFNRVVKQSGTDRVSIQTKTCGNIGNSNRV